MGKRDVTRDDPEWAQAVFEEVLKELDRAGLGEDLRITPLVSWLEGDIGYVIYTKYGRRGIYGQLIDTKDAPTGTFWPDSEQIGWEYGKFCLEEPHEEAPEEYAREKRIFWLGEKFPDLPNFVEEAQERAKKMGF